jgi:hypothetical protein
MASRQGVITTTTEIPDCLRTEQAGSSSNGISRFESQPQRRPSLICFVIFLRPDTQIQGWHLNLGHDRHLHVFLSSLVTTIQPLNPVKVSVHYNKTSKSTGFNIWSMSAGYKYDSSPTCLERISSLHHKEVFIYLQGLHKLRQLIFCTAKYQYRWYALEDQLM